MGVRPAGADGAGHRSGDRAQLVAVDESRVMIVSSANVARTQEGPFRRGQDNTKPAPGETTVGENLTLRATYLEAVEFATLTWVDWCNTRRLLEPIGYVPPAEFEARYYEQAAVA